MPRLRKLRRKQKYQYHVNRQRLNQKMKKLPDIKCDVVKNAWDKKKSLADNLTSMGLVVDPNTMKNLKIPSAKVTYPAAVFGDEIWSNGSDKQEERGSSDIHISDVEQLSLNNHVVVELERQAKESYYSKKAHPHPIPKEMLRKLTVLLDKFGEDFEGMAKDHLNYNQETPAQLRSQINRLKSIPQQWIPYLKSRQATT